MVLATWQKWAVGSLFFLLPFLCNPFGGEMYLQFEAPKLFGAFILGNLCFAFFVASHLHHALGIAHMAFSLSVLLTGFGGSQLYPFAYWCAGLSIPIFLLSTVNHRYESTYKLLWVW